jgi:hypothetical protein
LRARTFSRVGFAVSVAFTGSRRQFVNRHIVVGNDELCR